MLASRCKVLLLARAIDDELALSLSGCNESCIVTFHCGSCCGFSCSLSEYACADDSKNEQNNCNFFHLFPLYSKEGGEKPPL